MTAKELAMKQMDITYETASKLTLAPRAKTLINNFMGQACGIAMLGMDICQNNGESNEGAEIMTYFNEVISKKIAELYRMCQEEE